MLPLAVPYRLFQGIPLAKQIYGTVAGMTLCHLAYGPGFLHMVYAALASYVLSNVVPRRYAGWAVFAVTFAHLTVSHVLNASGTAWNNGTIDFTGSQMILVLKCTGTALSYSDGLLKAEDMSSWQKKSHLKTFPNFVEYLGHLFDPNSVLVGPALDFCDYHEFIHDKGGANLPRKPSCVLPALKHLAGNLMCVGIHLVGNSIFPTTLVGSEEFFSFSLPYKIFSIWAVCVAFRGKYYFVWGLAHTSMIISGQALHDVKSEDEDCWDRGLNVRPLQVETAVTAMDFTSHWNICTGNWLRHNVYMRAAPKGSKPGFGALLLTQIVSGWWHGLYPGYWMFFVSSTVMVLQSRWVSRILRNMGKTAAMLTKLVSGLNVSMQLSYLGTSFMLLQFEPSLKVWSSMYFIGHITMVLGVLISMIPAGTPSSPKTPKNE